MSRLILLYAISFVVLVNAHPLVPTIGQCPALHYQPSAYQPYGESIHVLQPSNNNPYSQQVLIQSPISNDQHLQVPSLLDQISQIYRDKLLSNPTLRTLLDPYNQYGKDAKTSLQPYNTGGVVNNYIILTPEYLKENATVSKTNPKSKRVKNKPNNKVKKTVNSNQINKKCNVESFESSNNKRKRKTKESTKQAWSFNTDNINCFTPVDVLENEKYVPVAKNRNIYKDVGQCDKVKAIPKSSNKFDGEANLHKPKKTNNNRSKKKSKVNKIIDGKKGTIDNNYGFTTPGEETKQLKTNEKLLDCAKKDESPYCSGKIPDDISRICEQNMDDSFLSNLLQQDCTHLENRRTRNSKSNAGKKDFRYVYPNLPDDISKSMAWYMNGIFTPPSYQQASNTNFQRNIYPFDLSQIYHIPQYSKAKKSNGNKENNNNTKRKKKKKKKPLNPKPDEENTVNSDNSQIQEKVDEISTETNTQVTDTIQCPDINTAFLDTNTLERETNSQTSEKNVLISNTCSQISETNTQIPEVSTQTTKTRTQIPATTLQTLFTSTQNPVINTEIPEKSTLTKPDEVNSFNNSMIKTTASPGTKEITTETIIIKPNISYDELLHFLKDLIKLSNIEDAKDITNLKIVDQNEEKVNITNKKENLSIFKNTYNIQIPESIGTTGNQNNTMTLDGKQTYLKEIPFLLDLHKVDLVPEMGSEDERFNVFDYTLMKDYYPNFIADNFAYWLSGEETDMQNIHDRYFYTTDKNIDSIEASSPEEKNDLYNERKIQNGFESEDIIDALNDNKNVEDTHAHNIVFRIPPGLEIPDFITRKINMDKQDSIENNYHYESKENYDKFNADNFADISDHLVEMTDRYQINGSKPESLVETIYAKSKVVKYGQGQETIEPIISEINHIPTVNGDVTIINDGEKTIVLAKSIPPEEFW